MSLPSKSTPAQTIMHQERKAKREALERAYALQLRQMGVPMPVSQFEALGGIPGAPRYIFDFAYPSNRILIEINGGKYQRSGHNSPAGLERDWNKSNWANINGWCLLIFSADMIASGQAMAWTKDALNRWPPF